MLQEKKKAEITLIYLARATGGMVMTMGNSGAGGEKEELAEITLSTRVILMSSKQLAVGSEFRREIQNMELSVVVTPTS